MLTQGNDLTATEIDQKDCTESHKTLGLMKAPNRSQAGELARLNKKSNQRAAAIPSNSVTHTDSIIACRACHFTSIDCSLGVTCITAAQCDKIQCRAASAFLATGGCNRHFPHASVFAPKSHSGVGMVPFYLLQGQQCLRLLLRHMLDDTELGRQIRIDSAWMQLEAGTHARIFENTDENSDCIEDGWVMGIRRFLPTVAGAIQFTTGTRPTMHGRDDEHFMDLFRHQGLTLLDLKRRNRCRLHFQVARVSDATTIASDRLHAHVLPLERDSLPMSSPACSTSKLQWPRQPRPGHKACRLWTSTLKRTLLQADDSLRHPLGTWTTPVHDPDRHCSTLHHANINVIHQHDGRIHRTLPLISGARRVIKATLENTAPSIHTPGRPADTLKIQRNTLTAQLTPLDQRLSTITNTTFHPRFRHVPKWAADLLQHLGISTNTRTSLTSQIAWQHQMAVSKTSWAASSSQSQSVTSSSFELKVQHVETLAQ
jgi:hypothetical protein